MSKNFKDVRSAALALLSSSAFLAESELRLLGEISGEWGAMASWKFTMLAALLDREGLPPLELILSKRDQLESLASAISRRRDLSEKDRAMAVACLASPAFAIDNLDWLESFQTPVRVGLEVLI